MRGLLLWMKGEWQLLSALTWSLILSLQPVKYSLERLAAKWSKNVLIYWAPMLEVKEWYKVRLVASYGLCCLEVSTVQCLQQWHSWREIVHPKEFLRLTPNCIWIVDVGEKLIDFLKGRAAAEQSWPWWNRLIETTPWSSTKTGGNFWLEITTCRLGPGWRQSSFTRLRKFAGFDSHGKQQAECQQHPECCSSLL